MNCHVFWHFASLRKKKKNLRNSSTLKLAVVNNKFSNQNRIKTCDIILI